jgi:hypothetical protein
MLNHCDEESSSEQLPVHIILGASDYQRIRSMKKLVLRGNPDQDPRAEYTLLDVCCVGEFDIVICK